MTGIVNSTGAKSGIIGTTVGTPAVAAGTVIQTQITVLTSGGSERVHNVATGSYGTINLNGDLEITGFTATNGNTLIITTSGYSMRCSSDATYRFEHAIFSSSTNIGSLNTFAGSSSYRRPLYLCIIKENISGYSSVAITVQCKREGTGTGGEPTMTVGSHGQNSGQGDEHPYIMIQEIQA